jgi:uncharacterized damage-inducible protein DinB
MEKFFDTNVEADYLDEYLFTRCMDINYAGLWNNHHSTFNTINWHDDATIPSESEFNSKLAELTAEYESSIYARSRKEEYDALNQFELISDDTINGTSTHKDAIEAIKAKYPKP